MSANRWHRPGDLSLSPAVSSWNVCWAPVERERRGETVSVSSSPSHHQSAGLSWSQPTLGPWRSSPSRGPSWGPCWPAPAGGWWSGPGSWGWVWRCPGSERSPAAGRLSPAQSQVVRDLCQTAKLTKHTLPGAPAPAPATKKLRRSFTFFWTVGTRRTRPGWVIITAVAGWLLLDTATVNHQRSLVKDLTPDHWPTLTELFARNKYKSFHLIPSTLIISIIWIAELQLLK